MTTALTFAPESLLWYWITERHSIFLKKSRGESKPWTDDPIFQTYKFTNPFRENDRGTIWLRENFLEPHRNDHLELLVFNCCWYRMFNFWGTGELLGWQTEWNPGEAESILTATLLEGKQVFTGAHIVRSAFGRPKIDSIVDVCSDLWRLRGVIVDETIRSKSLEEVFKRLLKVNYVGPFMAYEMVTDFRHTRLLEDAKDIMTWANAGPGAILGLQRLGLPSTPPSAALDSMRGLLARSRANLPEWVPDLEMRDIEHSLCEFMKWTKVKYNEGRPRSKYPGVA